MAFIKIAHPMLDVAVKNAIENSIENGYDPLLQFDIDLAVDLFDYDQECGEYSVEEIKEAIGRYRAQNLR